MSISPPGYGHPGRRTKYTTGVYAREGALKTWAERIETLAKSKNVVQLQRTA